MVEAHNGRVWAESTGQGKGSSFFIELAALHPVTTTIPVTPAVSA
jgi:signal transduction histidine kinase